MRPTTYTTSAPLIRTETSSPAVSVVIPCLNEQSTIAKAVHDAKEAFRSWPGGAEVIVADNASIDQSVPLAQAAGAHVISVAERGYGAALQAGFAIARAPYIVYADADLTYDWGEGPQLVVALNEKNADMALGTRTRGVIHSGAMPMLHRYLGTPILTTIINLLFKGTLTDCNSGFRALRRDRLAVWRASSSGMEFASELLVNALTAGAKIIEIPITLRRGKSERKSHLQTWRDGMRHLLTILARAPWLFVNTGLGIVFISALIAIACAFGPVVLFGRFALFDYHTLIFATLFGFLGTQILGTGLLLQLRRPKIHGRIASALIDLNEGFLFWFLFLIIVLVAAGMSFVGWSWAKHGFSDISFLKLTLSILYVATVAGSLAMSIFHAHLLKRA